MRARDVSRESQFDGMERPSRRCAQLHERFEALCGSRLVGGSRRLSGRSGCNAFAKNSRSWPDHAQRLDQDHRGGLGWQRDGTNRRTAIFGRVGLTVLMCGVVSRCAARMLVKVTLGRGYSCNGLLARTVVQRMRHQRQRSMPNNGQRRDQHDRVCEKTSGIGSKQSHTAAICDPWVYHCQVCGNGAYRNAYQAVSSSSELTQIMPNRAMAR